MVGPLPERLRTLDLEPQGRRVLCRDDLLLPAPRGEDAGGEAMGMRTASPWWASLIFGVGLLFLLLGERLFGYTGSARWPLDVIALVAILGPTGLRAYTTFATTGSRRRVERTLLACQLGVLVSLLLYLLP